MKLIQKKFLKGAREFEIIDDTVYVQIKGLLKGEKSTISLTALDSEPVVNGSELEFHSRHHDRPLFSLYIDKPNAADFNAFVDSLKQRIAGEDMALAGVAAVSPDSTRPQAPGWNVYEEPPEFEGPDKAGQKKEFKPVNVGRLDQDITMLKTYLNEDDIRSFLDSLEALKAEPNSEAVFQNMVAAYNDLGFNQGAVLSYSTYLKILLSETIW